MKRYMKVRGVPGHLVADPRSALGAPRYVGKRRKVGELTHTGRHDDVFDEVEQVIELEERYQTKRLLLKAIKHGYLELLGECVAEGINEAIERLEGAE